MRAADFRMLYGSTLGECCNADLLTVSLAASAIYRVPITLHDIVRRTMIAAVLIVLLSIAERLKVYTLRRGRACTLPMVVRIFLVICLVWPPGETTPPSET